MSELVFATYAKELKDAWSEGISDPELINLLYDAVAIPTHIVNKSGEPITVNKGTASKIMNRQKGGNINKKIREHSHDCRVEKTIDDYFADHVLQNLLVGVELQLIHRLSEIIKGDSQIPDEEKSEVLSLAQINTLATFLSKAYLHTLMRDNVLHEEHDSSQHKREKMDEMKRHPLPAESPSSPIKKKERRYISALMDVYGQLAKVDGFNLETLESYPKHKEHFIRQRSDYLCAEAVRRGTRDIYGDADEENFDVFLDEIWSGVIDIWESPYVTGFERLKEVLVAAIRTPADQCWLTKETAWIGNHQKKGACHVLVNEGKLEGWVIL